jgi:hypothetical protein
MTMVLRLMGLPCAESPTSWLCPPFSPLSGVPSYSFKIHILDRSWSPLAFPRSALEHSDPASGARQPAGFAPRSKPPVRFARSRFLGPTPGLPHRGPPPPGLAPHVSTVSGLQNAWFCPPWNCPRLAKSRELAPRR